MKGELDRDTKALLALHDLGSREGATSRWVMAEMIKEGFSKDEIARAAKSYGSHSQ